MHKIKDVNKAIDKIISNLSQDGHSDFTVNDYRHCFNSFCSYLAELGIEEVNEQTGLSFIEYKSGIKLDSIYCRTDDRRLARRLRVLCSLFRCLECGEAYSVVRRIRPPFECPEGFADEYDAFLKYLDNSTLASVTRKTNREIVQKFLLFLHSSGTVSSDMLDVSDLDAFLLLYQDCRIKYIGSVHYVLRKYLGFLFEQGYCILNLAESLPHLRIPRKSRIPHAWTKDELRRILAAVDREDPAGKRDYAIFLLMIQTGLRAGDIRNIRMGDIDWRRKIIRIVQGKTGQSLELPLPDHVGWAIIDYLKNGRPSTDCDSMFVRHNTPCGPIGSTATLDTSLCRYIRKAGIAIKNGEPHGVHTLRHSLAGNMLKAGAPLPVISQTLGHSDINTTSIYLKINTEDIM